MAHYTQHQFVRWTKEFFPAFFEGKKVLEIGSLDINGSVREFYDNCEYTGLDVGPGPGVDIVCGGQDYDAPDASFDVVTSFEAMEHNPYWKETFANMIRLVRPGGMVIMTCATAGRPEHGTSRSKPSDSPLTASIGWDYYRNLSSKDFEEQFPLEKHFSRYFFAHYYYGCDLLFFAFRRDAEQPANAQKAMQVLKARYLVRNLLQSQALKTMVNVRLGRVT
jgi:SAM-dependent methyltransferase